MWYCTVCPREKETQIQMQILDITWLTCLKNFSSNLLIYSFLFPMIPFEDATCDTSYSLSWWGFVLLSLMSYFYASYYDIGVPCKLLPSYKGDCASLLAVCFKTVLMICLMFTLNLFFAGLWQTFPKFLGIAMELFFAACDDEESDVRLKADECLNKIVRVSNVATRVLQGKVFGTLTP